MSIMDMLSSRECWEDFYNYKMSLACPKTFAKRLRAFIDEGGYIPVCEAIAQNRRFPLPRKSVIGKMGTDKKRTVYTYPEAENTMLKLLTHLMIRRYDSIFASKLYSFRPGVTAKDAVKQLRGVRGIEGMYSYNADISDYFNSIPVDKLLPVLRSVLGDDPELYAFLSALLSEPEVSEKGAAICEKKGIMAGTPQSSFFANLYLNDLDHSFEALGIPYARYSDDIILFAKTKEETLCYGARLRAFLADKGLSINADKEHLGAPGEGWSFLGFRCEGDMVNIAPATVHKLKQKMRRKTRALRRWCERNEISGERAAKAFIRVFNKKLLESSGNNELTWSNWFFSVINTTQSLKEIDLYAQDCIRYLVSGKRTKGRYDVRYDDMKKLGYKSLVHAYYEGGAR